MPLNQNLTNPPMKRRVLRPLLFALIFLGAISAASVLLLRPQQTLPDFLQNRTQGYEHFLAAAEEIAGRPRDVTNGFANYVAMNKRAYDAIDRTLKEQIEPPAHNYKPGTMNPMELVAFRGIAQALIVRSNAAESQGRLNDALTNCFESIRFGQNVERGPLINFLVGSAIELMTLKRLEDLLPQLTDTNLSAAIFTLRQLNHARLPFSEVKRREEYFLSQNTTNFIHALRERFSTQTREAYKDAEERYLSTAAQMEVLATTMAARRYELNQKNKLTSLTDLVPAFLDSIPFDSYSKKPLRLTRTNDQLIIYSVGPNGIDNSGRADDIALHHQDEIGYKLLTNSLNQIAK